jgi:hypothetical protein
MTTEELINVLAADRHVERKVDLYLLCSLLAGTCLVAVVFFAAVGFRDDIRSALDTVRFLFKFAIVVPLAVFAVGTVFRSATPLPVFGWWGRLLAIPPILLALGALAELTVVPSSLWMPRLIGSNAVNCMTIIPMLGAGPLVMIILALRRGAPSNPGISGALAGLAASGIAATFYATNCFDDSPLFVITWYPLATATLLLAGYIGGLRYLRW